MEIKDQKRFKVNDQKAVYFITFTLAARFNLFEDQACAGILVDSFNHCIRRKGLALNAWAIMPDHVHFVGRDRFGNLTGMLRDFKSFTAWQIMKQLLQDEKERDAVKAFQWLGRGVRGMRRCRCGGTVTTPWFARQDRLYTC